MKKTCLILVVGAVCFYIYHRRPPLTKQSVTAKILSPQEKIITNPAKTVLLESNDLDDPAEGETPEVPPWTSLEIEQIGQSEVCENLTRTALHPLPLNGKKIDLLPAFNSQDKSNFQHEVLRIPLKVIFQARPLVELSNLARELRSKFPDEVSYQIARKEYDFPKRAQAVQLHFQKNEAHYVQVLKKALLIYAITQIAAQDSTFAQSADAQDLCEETRRKLSLASPATWNSLRKKFDLLTEKYAFDQSKLGVSLDQDWKLTVELDEKRMTFGFEKI